MFEKAATVASAAQDTGFALAHPLDDFYKISGQPMPPLSQVEGSKVPEPYKSLLVHQNDMTPTLEKFYERTIHLQVVGRRQTDGAYFREVVLLLDGTEQPVEFGAIKINLDLFPKKAREEILHERLPLGRILHEHKIPHTSRPRAFIKVASDRLINGLFNASGAQVLYGRRNTLFDPKNRPLAEIVEILPAANQ
jgi:chorismate-pyruvate lyase